MERSKELETILQNQFKRLETDFRNLLIKKEPNVVLRSDAWTNNNGIGTGWLSCSSGNQQGESLELTVDFKFNDENIFIEYDIYWSDGSFVEELGNFEISFSDDNDKLTTDIEQCVNKIREVGLPRYLVCVIENLGK